MASSTALALCELKPGTCLARQPRFFTAGAQPRRSWVICHVQREQQVQPSEPEVSRRIAVLGAMALAAVPLLVSGPAAAAENEAVTRGLNKYIRRKKYDDIESYLPPLLAARGQLIRSGYILAQDPNAARVMLREGAFTGLRDNVRAVGDYAGREGRAEDGTQAVQGFFKALEAYDFALLQGSRNKEGIDVEGSEGKLKEAVAALDKLVGLVPEGMAAKARKIVDELEAESQAEREQLAAEQALRLQQQLEGLL